MNNFAALFAFELKKIFKRKIVWISLGIMVAGAVFMSVGETLSSKIYSADGTEVTISGYETLQMTKENAVSISGLAVDDALLTEVKSAYRGVYHTEYTENGDGTSSSSVVVKNINDESLSETKERIKKQEKYQKIYQYIGQITEDYNAIHSIDEEGLYQARMDYLQSEMGWQKLTDDEKTYWIEQEESIEKPFTYEYCDGWKSVLHELYTLNLLVLMLITICLSTVFSDEHVKKTDQLILSSRYGKQKLFAAKMAAGITYGIFGAVVLLLCALIPTLLIYGAEGFNAVLQICYPMTSWNITVGQAVLIMIIVYIAATVLYSVFVMFLSEALKNSVAVMGIMTGGLLFTLMVSLPYKWRVLSQIYELLPTLIIGIWNFSNFRLFKIFGIHFSNFQAAPMVYVVLSALLVLCGKRVYRKYQISGR